MIDMYIYFNGDLLEQVDFPLFSHQYNRNWWSKDVRTRLVIGRSAFKSPNCIWKDHLLSVKKRILLTVIWQVKWHYNGAEMWAQVHSSVKRIAAFEIKCYRRMLRVSWRQHRTNSSILEEVEEQNQLLHIVKCRKLWYFGHVPLPVQTLCTSTRARPEENLVGLE